MEKYDYWNNVEVPIELIGYPNMLNPNAQFVSSSRIDMYGSHLMQAMVLDNPEPNLLFTGIENNLIAYNFDKSRRKYPFEILYIIPKYIPKVGQADETCPLYYVIGATIEPNGVRHLDVFEIEKYFMGQNGFGYIPNLNTSSLRKGEVIDPDVQLVTSPRVQGDAYCMGTNLKTIFASFPEPIEDAFIISETAAKKLQTTMIKTKVINCRADWRPLNLYGNEDIDKFLPDIGSRVREDGILCAFRPMSLTTAVADADPRSLREVLPFQDNIIQIEAGAKILDLTFIVNWNKLNNLYEQAEEYVNSHTKCWENIWLAYFKYKNKYPLTNAMWELVRRSIYHIISNKSKIRPLDMDIPNFELEGVNRQVADFIQVEVTYTIDRVTQHGFKITGLDGSKGVIGHIYPDEVMPVDEYGERADLWIDMSSPVARNNPDQLYECGLNRIGVFVVKKMASVYEQQGVDAAFEVAMEWCNDVNPNYERLIREGCTNTAAKKAFVTDTIDKGFHMWVPPTLNTMMSAPGDKWRAVRNMMKWQEKWEAWSTPVRFGTKQADGSFKFFTTEEPMMIASKYILALNKIPEMYSPGPASINNFGIPVKSKFDSKDFPIGKNPYKLGEDELRILGLDCDPREVTRFQGLLANSPTATNLVIKCQFIADRPTAVMRTPITNGEIYRTNAIARVFHNTSAVMGFDTKNTKITRADIPDDIYNVIWVNDQAVEEDAVVDAFEREEERIKRFNKKIDAKSEQNRLFIMGDDDDSSDTATEDED